MDLSTTYLGLELPHPFMPGASPLAADLSMVRRLEDAGAAAIVMYSLFEEQIEAERGEALCDIEGRGTQASIAPDRYLDQIRRVKEAVKIPVIASLNGVSAAWWLEYARLAQEAGADALELNVYYVATDPEESGAAVEQRPIEALLAVKRHVTIPVVVKLSPFYSSIAHLASRLDAFGADGLILFNRFYQPDIEIERLVATPAARLSDAGELLLRLRWLAILSGRVRASLAASGGVHGVLDGLKAVLAGAHAIQVVSALLVRGPEHLRTLIDGLSEWGDRLGYASVADMRGCLSLARCPDEAASERAGYVKLLQSWREF